MKRKLLALLLSAAMLLAICLPALCAAAESDAVSSLEENVESGTAPALEENFDVNAAKNELLAKTSEADVNAYLETLSEAKEKRCWMYCRKRKSGILLSVYRLTWMKLWLLLLKTIQQ